MAHSDEAEKYSADAFATKPQDAIYFSKRVTQAVPDGGFIEAHTDLVQKLDYECELAVVLGTEGDGLADGTIDMIATDHAPHSTEEKALPFPRAPNGILGLESAFSVCNRVLVESGPVGFQRMIDALTAAPARILGIPLPDSEILVETEGCFTIPPPVCSMASNCPWAGFQGWGYVIG